MDGGLENGTGRKRYTGLLCDLRFGYADYYDPWVEPGPLIDERLYGTALCIDGEKVATDLL